MIYTIKSPPSPLEWHYLLCSFYFIFHCFYNQRRMSLVPPKKPFSLEGNDGGKLGTAKRGLLQTYIGRYWLTPPPLLLYHKQYHCNVFKIIALHLYFTIFVGLSCGNENLSTVGTFHLVLSGASRDTRTCLSFRTCVSLGSTLWPSVQCWIPFTINRLPILERK